MFSFLTVIIFLSSERQLVYGSPKESMETYDTSDDACIPCESVYHREQPIGICVTSPDKCLGCLKGFAAENRADGTLSEICYLFNFQWDISSTEDATVIPDNLKTNLEITAAVIISLFGLLLLLGALVTCLLMKKGMIEINWRCTRKKSADQVNPSRPKSLRNGGPQQELELEEVLIGGDSAASNIVQPSSLASS